MVCSRVSIMPVSVNDISCFCFNKRFRRAVHAVVSYWLFDVVIIIVILASSLSLAIQDPVQDTNIRNVILDQIDYGFTAIFALEMILKVDVLLNYTICLRNYCEVRFLKISRMIYRFSCSCF